MCCRSVICSTTVPHSPGRRRKYRRKKNFPSLATVGLVEHRLWLYFCVLQVLPHDQEFHTKPIFSPSCFRFRDNTLSAFEIAPSERWSMNPNYSTGGELCIRFCFELKTNVSEELGWYSHIFSWSYCQCNSLLDSNLGFDKAKALCFRL